MKEKSKFLLLTIVLFLAFNSIEAQKLGDVNAQSLGPIKKYITETTYDFGTVKQDTRISRSFKFINDGTEPLIIKQVKNSELCTVVEYPIKAIKPGNKSSITVNCNLKEVASESELVSIMTNASNSSKGQNKGVFELRIKGVVKAK